MSQSQCTNCGAPISLQDRICPYCSTPVTGDPTHHDDNNVTETRTESVGPNGMRTVTVTRTSSSSTTSSTTSSSSGINPDFDLSAVQHLMDSFSKDMGGGIIDSDFMKDVPSSFVHPAAQQRSPANQPSVQKQSPAPKSGGCLGMILVLLCVASMVVYVSIR